MAALTGRENTLLLGVLAGMTPRRRRAAEMEEVRRRSGLGEHYERLVGELLAGDAGTLGPRGDRAHGAGDPAARRDSRGARPRVPRPRRGVRPRAAGGGRHRRRHGPRPSMLERLCTPSAAAARTDRWRPTDGSRRFSASTSGTARRDRGGTVTREELRGRCEPPSTALDREPACGWSLLRPRAALARPRGRRRRARRPGVARRRGRGAHSAWLRRDATAGARRPRWRLRRAVRDASSGCTLQAELRLAGAVPAGRGGARERHRRRASRSPATDWLLWILLLRALVDKGELPERHRPARRSALAQRWEGGPPALEDDRPTPRDRARRRSWRPPRRATGTAAAPRRRAGEPVADRTRSLARLGGCRRSASLRGRRGLSVAVLGPDGAGQDDAGRRARREACRSPTRVQYMGLTGGRLPKADALRVPGVVLRARTRDPLDAGTLARLVPPGARARSCCSIATRSTARFRRAVRLTPPGRLSRRLQRRACPMPDLVLLLDASGATMHASAAASTTAAVLEAWRAAYGRLRGKVRGARDDRRRAAVPTGAARAPRRGSGGATRELQVPGRRQ